jgi:hypothetical protein
MTKTEELIAIELPIKGMPIFIRKKLMLLIEMANKTWSIS